jgi:acetyltransferase
VLVRPIRPEDAEAHAAFFARLDPESVRLRFFSALKQLSAEQIARMTQVDYDREMAFIATREGQTLGVARAVREPGAEDCEFAVIVQPDRRGRGLARHLMERLIAWARTQGLRDMVGLVLAENTLMLGFVRALGFVTRRVPDEEDVVEARLPLQRVGA